jgi:hypothetical protein
VKARRAIHAELAWDDHATACGIVARSSSPVLKLCRMLVEAGHNPCLPLEAWRKGVLCLRVRSIDEAAGLELNASGTGFRQRREPDAAPPIDLNAPGHAEVAAGDDGFVDWPPSDDGGAAR